MRFSDFFRLISRSATRAYTLGAKEDPLLDRRIVLLGSPIDDATTNAVIAKLLFLDTESHVDPIHFVINSPGGLVLAGLAIMDTMDQLRAPIATHCLRTAHSMAAVILANGRAGLRTAESSSTITFTLPRAPDNADAEKKKDAVRFGEILIAKTAAATKRPVDDIRKVFEDGADLSAEEAVATGIVDRIGDTMDFGG